MLAKVRVVSDLIEAEWTGEVAKLGFGARLPDGRFEVEQPILRTDDGHTLTDIFDLPATITVEPLVRKSRVRRWWQRIRGRHAN